MLHTYQPPSAQTNVPPTLADDVVELIPVLRAFARSLTGNVTQADDLVQETLLKALANIDKFEAGTRLRAWMFTIMRNTFYTSIRKSQRESTGREDCVSGLLTVQSTQIWSTFGREVMEAIQRLPPHYRDTLVLVTMLGEPYEDAARICGCTIGTIKSRVNRARLLLRGMLADLDGVTL